MVNLVLITEGEILSNTSLHFQLLIMVMLVLIEVHRGSNSINLILIRVTSFEKLKLQVRHLEVTASLEQTMEELSAMEFTKFSQHADVVHDISFDFYGRRLETCASDKRIKVWDLVDETGEWTCYDISRAHNDSIWRMSWAHPEFGQLIASCSEDKSIWIWEEQESVTHLKTEQRDRWQREVQLSDSEKSVTDAKFAPRHLGLKVAAASADGTVKIYEATDVFSLNSCWQLQEKISEGSRRS